MIVYLDASVIVKLYVEEAGSEAVAEMVGATTAVGTALITMAEVAAALAGAVRRRALEGRAARVALRAFRREWERFNRLRVTEYTVQRAADLAWEHNLRGYDAVHLACAVLWHEMMALPVILATYDRQLWQAGRHSGMQVWPEERP